MGKFQELRVWQESMELVDTIYRISNHGKISKDFSFKDQIRRSAVSIPSNIAEGDESGSNRQSVRYFHIAKGSSAELITQLLLANRIGYIDDSVKDSLVNQARKVSATLNKLIKVRSNKN